MNRKYNVDLTDQVFGQWEVLCKSTELRRNRVAWECVCSCGTERILSQRSLTEGRTRSCGCYSVKYRMEKQIKHGLTKTPTHRLWAGVKARCLNPNDTAYKYYGGRGIIICDEWKDNFMVFHKWCLDNGYKQALELDREDNDGNYCPENCRFITHRQNMLNRGRNKNNTSGYTGIGKRKNSWGAEITVDGKVIYIKQCKLKFQAVLARNQYIIDNNLQDEYDIQSLLPEDQLIKESVERDAVEQKSVK